MLILGDNPFFGINHASAAKARGYRQTVEQRDWSGPIATIAAAIDQGVEHLMMSAHHEAPELLKAAAERGLNQHIALIPAVPYLHRLNGIVAAKGVTAALVQSVDYGTGIRSLISLNSPEVAGLAAFVAKETAAMENFGFNVSEVALQNIFVDLLLGLGQHQKINQLFRILRKRGKRLIAITMNPLLADRVLDPDIVLCTHYNVNGYMVQPNLEAFRNWLEGTQRETWAMGVMASGRVPLENVMSDRYLQRFAAIVVGCSRPQSITQFSEAYALLR